MSKDFFDYNPHELEFVPFDIETTGFKSAEGDVVTNIVLHNRGMYHIWINTDGNTVSAEEIADTVEEESKLDNIIVYACESEKQLLSDVYEYLNENTSDATILTAFNGETYKASTDFDVPFLRTRCIKNQLPWILKGFWYTDSYEILGDKTRMDTTVKSEPSLEQMKRSDLTTFVDDMDFEIRYDGLNKQPLVTELENMDSVTESIVDSWATNNEQVNNYDPTYLDSFTVGQLQDFVDEKSYNINYNKLTKEDLIREIRSTNYSEEMLVEWHEEKGRDIGREEMTTLEDLHEVLIESKHNDDEWIENVPIDVELFEPFDPYESSGEAVTGYYNQDYVGVILHCLADVARTVNLTRIMAMYTPQSEYRPKTL